MAIDFKPATTGSLTGNAVLTDNNLNLANSTQTIKLAGTGTPAPASITSPKASSPLSGVIPFVWNPGSGSIAFWLKISAVSPGGTDVYSSGQVAYNVTSATANIPAKGARLYVRLCYLVNGVWNYVDYTYTEASSGTVRPL